MTGVASFNKGEWVIISPFPFLFARIYIMAMQRIEDMSLLNMEAAFGASVIVMGEYK
ncbi:hypothetical protein AC4HA11_1855 [Escherichia phage vB_EcoA_4HA11]|nr:hypothetical protein AC4HA11_1855 [Escherichia phage vB_EcoA_4HA11]